MPRERTSGPMCTERRWQLPETQTMSRHPGASPRPLDGGVLGPLPSPCVAVDSAEDEQEMLIIPVTEFVNFLASTTAQSAATIDDLLSLRRILKEMGFTGKAVIRTYKGTDYIVLSGRAGLRSILTGTRYRFDNTKIVKMVIGKAGLAKSALKARF